LQEKTTNTYYFRGTKIDVQPFFLISHSCVLRDKNWQENKKISEHFAGQFASRALKPYALALSVLQPVRRLEGGTHFGVMPESGT
jgi:hypothetical protein